MGTRFLSGYSRLVNSESQSSSIGLAGSSGNVVETEPIGGAPLAGVDTPMDVAPSAETQRKVAANIL